MKKDRLIGIGAILTAIFFFYHTRSIRVPENIVDPGPRLLPYLAEALMVICGIGIIVQSEIKKEEEKTYLTKDGWKRLGIAFGVLIAYAIALTYVGFIWATPFMAFALVNMLSGEKKGFTCRKHNSFHCNFSSSLSDLCKRLWSHAATRQILGGVSWKLTYLAYY